MHIKIIELAFIIVLGWLMGTNDSKRNRLYYIILCSMGLIFIGAMRSPEWMERAYSIDTLKYKEMFETFCDMNWDEIWSSFLLRYLSDGDDFDIGYVSLNKVVGYFTQDFHIFSVIADLIFFIPFGILLNRYCKSMSQLIFGFVFYIALIQMYLFGGARQMFAIGFDMIALLSILDKKNIRAAVFFLFGVTIHFSSLLFLIPMLMIWFNVKSRFLKYLHGILLFLAPIALMMPNDIILFMGNLTGVERYSNYGMNAIQGGAVTFIILIEMLSLFCMIAIKKKDLNDNEIFRKLYVMVPFFTFFAPLIRSNGSMDRIALYFYIYLVVLITFAVECMFKEKERRTVYALTITALSLLIVLNDNFIYFFFWER